MVRAFLSFPPPLPPTRRAHTFRFSFPTARAGECSPAPNFGSRTSISNEDWGNHTTTRQGEKVKPICDGGFFGARSV
eukprot:scaffold27882_cov61-Phaeocystis_antarctica.AAC.11